ncbi:MAG: hypothetical protein WBC44_11325 [Planctomycetaceae bacterium]
MQRIVLTLAVAAAAAFALDVGAQPPEGERDQPRDSERGDRPDGDRPDGDRGRGDGDRGPGRGGRGGFGSGGFRMPPLPVMRALDADENGELSAEEIGNAAKALKTLDKNGDGKLAGDEIRPQFGPGGPGGPRPDPAQFVNRMMENDANKDGKLTADELPERMRGMVDRIDENDDDAVDKAELEAMARRFGEGRGPGGRGPDGDRDRDGRRGDRDGDRPNRDRPEGDRPDGDAPSRDDL